jgi:hypothetical protein
VLILRLSRRRWSLPLVEEEEDDGAVEELSVQERIDEEWNDLFGIVLPPIGSNLTPYTLR